MIANKMIGKKGVLFTAAYVTAFNDMKDKIRGNQKRPEVSPSGLANLIRITRRVMLDMGNTPNEIGQMVNDMFQTWDVLVPEEIQKQIPGQLYISEANRPMIGK